MWVGVVFPCAGCGYVCGNCSWSGASASRLTPETGSRAAAACVCTADCASSARLACGARVAACVVNDDCAALIDCSPPSNSALPPSCASAFALLLSLLLAPVFLIAKLSPAATVPLSFSDQPLTLIAPVPLYA